MSKSANELTDKLEKLCVKRAVDETTVEKIIGEVFMKRLRETER